MWRRAQWPHGSAGLWPPFLQRMYLENTQQVGEEIKNCTQRLSVPCVSVTACMLCCERACMRVYPQSRLTCLSTAFASLNSTPQHEGMEKFRFWNAGNLVKHMHGRNLKINLLLSRFIRVDLIHANQPIFGPCMISASYSFIPIRSCNFIVNVTCMNRVSGTPGMCVDAVRQVGLEPYTAVLNGSRQWL